MHYKDMEVWKESISFAKCIYLVTKKFPNEEIYGLTSQVRRSVVSIASNIAEGCARKSNKDTARFIDIAIGSLAELDTQLLIAQELEYIFIDKDLTDRISKISALLQGLKKFLENH